MFNTINTLETQYIPGLQYHMKLSKYVQLCVVVWAPAHVVCA